MNRDEVLEELHRAIREERNNLDRVEALRWAIDNIEGRPSTPQPSILHRIANLESFKAEVGPMIGRGMSQPVVKAIDEVCHTRTMNLSGRVDLACKAIVELQRFVRTLADAASKLEG